MKTQVDNLQEEKKDIQGQLASFQATLGKSKAEPGECAKCDVLKDDIDRSRANKNKYLQQVHELNQKFQANMNTRRAQHALQSRIHEYTASAARFEHALFEPVKSSSFSTTCRARHSLHIEESQPAAYSPLCITRVYMACVAINACMNRQGVHFVCLHTHMNI